MNIDHFWVYGQCKLFWHYAFETDEYKNRHDLYSQIIAETLGYTK